MEEVAEKVWEASVQSRVRFNRVPEKVSVKVWEALVQSQVRFNRVPGKVPEKVPVKVWEALAQSHVGAEPRQVQHGSGVQSQVKFNSVPKKVPGGFGGRARSSSTGFRRKFRRSWKVSGQSQGRFNRVPEKVPKVPEQVWEALVRSQVKFNSVPEKVREKVPEKDWEALVQSQVRFNTVPEKGLGGFGAEPSQVQQGSGEGSGEGVGGFGAEPGQGTFSREGSGEGSGRLWCRARSVQQGSGEGLGGFGAEPGQVQQVLRPFNLIHGKPAEVFPALGFAARFRKICKNKTLRLLGIPPKFFVVVYVLLICC